ncbi:MAG: FhaA domain-containing protein [Actinomycetota bacterium]
MPRDVEEALVEVMLGRRFLAGLGVPSVPTRYVVHMEPSDRVWMPAGAEDRMARALVRAAETAGFLIVGLPVVEFIADPRIASGHPTYWAGFAEEDLLVLADPHAAVEVFAASI